MGFTQVSLGAHRNPSSSLRGSHGYPWAHTATQSLLCGIHTDIPGCTQKPKLFSSGFTRISLGAHSNPISFLGIHTDIPGRTQKPFLFSSGFAQISLGAHSNPISFLWDSHRYPWAHTATRSLFFGIHTDIPGRTQQPDLFSLGFTQISLGAHSNPISFLWDSHRYPWAHTVTRSLFSGIHTDIPGRTQQPDLFSLGFTQTSLGAHSNPIFFFFFFFFFSLGFTQISLGAHSKPIYFFFLFSGIHTDIPGRTQQTNLFFFLFSAIHTDIPGRTQQPDRFSLGFTQISLGAHSNPISFLWDSHRYPWAHTATQSLSFFFFFFFFFFVFWDSHRYPWAHTATRSLFSGIHTDIPGRTQQPDLFSLGFTQISLGAHSNPISFLWDSHRYPWAHTATRSLFSGIHTDIPGRTQQPDLFSLGFTQISLGAHSNPISFLWDSHRHPWAHTATRSLFFGIHTDIPGRTQQPNLSLFFFFFSFFGIHTDIPGRTQQPDLFSLGFTQISLGAHSNPISFLWDSHRYPWAHTATQSLFFFFFVFWDSHRYPWAHTATRSLFFGIHTDIPGRTQQPDLFSLGFTQISLGAHSNPISFLWDSHRYPWAHTATQSLFFFFFVFWDSHRYPWAHTATRSLFFGIHTDIPGRTQQPDLFSLGFTQISLGAHSNPISFLWDSHRYPWAHTATQSFFFFFFFFFFLLFFGTHTDIPGRTTQPDLFSLGFTQISLGAHSNPSSSRWDSHRYPRAHTATQALLIGIHTDIPGLTQKPYHKKAH